MAVAPVGVNRCGNPEPFTGGLDREGDEEPPPPPPLHAPQLGVPVQKFPLGGLREALPPHPIRLYVQPIDLRRHGVEPHGHVSIPGQGQSSLPLYGLNHLLINLLDTHDTVEDAVLPAGAAAVEVRAQALEAGAAGALGVTWTATFTVFISGALTCTSTAISLLA